MAAKLGDLVRFKDQLRGIPLRMHGVTPGEIGLVISEYRSAPSDRLMIRILWNNGQISMELVEALLKL
jgi:hypothetical protein